MESEKEKIFLDTHAGLEILIAELKPIVENKVAGRKFPVNHRQNRKLLELAQELSAYFRYKWEQEKAENSVEYWRNASYQMLKKVKERLDEEK